MENIHAGAKGDWEVTSLMGMQLAFGHSHKFPELGCPIVSMLFRAG